MGAVPCLFLCSVGDCDPVKQTELRGGGGVGQGEAVKEGEGAGQLDFLHVLDMLPSLLL